MITLITDQENWYLIDSSLKITRSNINFVYISSFVFLFHSNKYFWTWFSSDAEYKNLLKKTVLGFKLFFFNVAQTSKSTKKIALEENFVGNNYFRN